MTTLLVAGCWLVVPLGVGLRRCSATNQQPATATFISERLRIRNEGGVRLLWLIDSLNMGGAESLVLPFARHLDRERYELFVCCLGTMGANALEGELRAAGIPTTNLGARNLRDVRAFRRLLRFVREERIDLVHAHLTYSAVWSALLSRITGIPSVASLHVAPSATLEQIKTARHRVLTNVRDRVMRFVLDRWSSAVIMVSDALRQTYLASGGLRAEKLRVVHNGIEVERFRRDREESRARLNRELDLPADARIAVTVSVLRPAKGVEVLLDAVRLVPDAYFVIVGDGPKREEWMELAQRTGIADRVRWAGFRRDVDAILAGCDLFVHPSLDDAFPTVLLEALAAGLPIVASRVGGIPEIVQDGVTGKLVPAGDAAALAAAIHSLLEDDTARMHMRLAASAESRRFSTGAWIERLTRVYAEVVK
jgi:glycosyltransferase involved in cell wall biosynthesis